MRTSRRFPTRYLSSKTLEQNNETKSQTTKTTDKTKLQNIFLMHETINFSRFGLFQFIVFSDFRKKANIPLDFRLDSASRNSRALPKCMLNIKSTIPICFYTPQKWRRIENTQKHETRSRKFFKICFVRETAIFINCTKCTSKWKDCKYRVTQKQRSSPKIE